MSVTPADDGQQNTKLQCLLIQLASVGDLLQSLMALRAVKQLYPNLEIHVMARADDYDILKKVSWIKNVYALPTEHLLEPLKKGRLSSDEAAENEKQSVRRLAAWLGRIISIRWDFLLNWSFSSSSSYLTALLPANIKLGLSWRIQQGMICQDDWSLYVQSMIQGDIAQNIHLTDILTTQFLTALQIHVGPPSEGANEPVTSKNFFSLISAQEQGFWNLRMSGKKWIGFQLGDPLLHQKWIDCASLVLSRHPDYHVVFLGDPLNPIASEGFKDLMTAASLPIERTLYMGADLGFDLWASAVGGCQWVITGSHPVVQLASVLGTRVFGVFSEPFNGVENGPYGNGHFFFVCRNKKTLSEKTIYACWRYAFDEWVPLRVKKLENYFERFSKSASSQIIQIYRSKIRPTQNGGGVYYQPLLNIPMSIDQWLATVMGQVARAWYCGWIAPVGQEISREALSPELLRELRVLDESSELLEKILTKARFTAERFHKRASRLRSDRVMALEDHSEIKEFGEQLKKLDDLLERVCLAHAPLRGFLQVSQVMMHNLRGNSLKEVVRHSSEAYRKLADGIKIFRTWLKHTLQLAKPAVLQNQKNSIPPHMSGMFE